MGGCERGCERVVLADPVALKFLEDDPSVNTVERKRELSGFELYIVEQWACSRESPTIVITTFTGQVQHKILTSVLEIPTSEKDWSPRLRAYMQSALHLHARKQDTGLGYLLVTNLSAFPSTLTILPVPNGDLRDRRELFFVNENLKRMGCSGRAGITLSQPSESTTVRFRQLYRTSEQLTVHEAVVQLVQMCQIALTMFAKLPPEYCDGLLCDVTERGLADWWTEIGHEYYNTEPSDGILGPSTAAALIGLFLGARNRLQAWGAPVSKDAFDIGALKRGIAQFQKSRDLPRTRRLDRDTLQKLHKHTAKAATSDGWGVPRAVKSTVAELGKGGEMVMGMVGARDKAGIADVETTDFEHFLKKFSGERCKWLWRGKAQKHPLRTAAHEHAPRDHASSDDNGAYIWGDSSSDEDDLPKPRKSTDDIYEPSANLSKTSIHSADRDQMARKTVLKTMTGRMVDARSGLGRFRDAVGTGLRGHHSKASREIDVRGASEGPARDSIDTDNGPRGALNQEETQTGDITSGPSRGISPSRYSRKERGAESRTDQEVQRPLPKSSVESEEEKSLRITTKHDPDFKDHQHIGNQQRYRNPAHKARSFVEVSHSDHHVPTSEIVTMGYISDTGPCSSSRDLGRSTPVIDYELMPAEVALEAEKHNCVQLEHMHEVLSKAKAEYSSLTADSLSKLQITNSQTEQVQEMLTVAQRARFDDFQAGVKISQEATQEGKELLTGRMQEIEALGAKLEYELGVLASKIEDVEEGVADLDRQVQDLESRSQALMLESQDYSWKNWAQALATRLRIK